MFGRNQLKEVPVDWTYAGFKQRYEESSTAGRMELVERFLTHAEPNPYTPGGPDKPGSLKFAFSDAKRFIQEAFATREHGYLWACNNGIEANLMYWKTRKAQSGMELVKPLQRAIAIGLELDPTPERREILIRFLRLNCTNRRFCYRAAFLLSIKREPKHGLTRAEGEDWRDYLLSSETFDSELLNEVSIIQQNLPYWGK